VGGRRPYSAALDFPSCRMHRGASSVTDLAELAREPRGVGNGVGVGIGVGVGLGVGVGIAWRRRRRGSGLRCKPGVGPQRGWSRGDDGRRVAGPTHPAIIAARTRHATILRITFGPPGRIARVGRQWLGRSATRIWAASQLPLQTCAATACMLRPRGTTDAPDVPTRPAVGRDPSGRVAESRARGWRAPTTRGSPSARPAVRPLSAACSGSTIG
jgi:hypothetical protein